MWCRETSNQNTPFSSWQSEGTYLPVFLPILPCGLIFCNLFGLILLTHSSQHCMSILITSVPLSVQPMTQWYCPLSGPSRYLTQKLADRCFHSSAASRKRVRKLSVKEKIFAQNTKRTFGKDISYVLSKWSPPHREHEEPGLQEWEVWKLIQYSHCLWTQSLSTASNRCTLVV